MLRSILSSILILACCTAGAQSKYFDGPYVFYSGDEILVEQVNGGKPKKQRYPQHKKRSLTLEVPVPGSEGKYFTVKLKPFLQEEPSEFKPASKILALSDIEGNFEGMVQLLKAGGVIDDDYNWIFSDGHLVICGDVFDRGSEVTSCLWMIYKLEQEARASGGYVHLVLGNHEIMNLSEDIRYVHPKYMESSTLLERTYMDLYGVDTELGQWLRTKNIMEKIGDNLFLHGGVSQEVNEAGLSLKKMNARVRPLYDKDGFDSLIREAKASLYFKGNTSPFWYRGYFVAPLASEAQVDSTLKMYNVKRIIVGHTLVDEIRSLYNGKVIAIDVNHHKGNHQALLIEQDQLYILTPKGKVDFIR